MLSKEQFIEAMLQKYEQIAALSKVKDFYTYEKDFDKIWTELGRHVLEKSISEVPVNDRKKTMCTLATESLK